MCLGTRTSKVLQGWEGMCDISDTLCRAVAEQLTGAAGDFPHSTCGQAHSDARKEKTTGRHAQTSHTLVLMLRLSTSTLSSDPARKVSDRGEMARS